MREQSTNLLTGVIYSPAYARSKRTRLRAWEPFARKLVQTTSTAHKAPTQQKLWGLWSKTVI